MHSFRIARMWHDSDCYSYWYKKCKTAIASAEQAWSSRLRSKQKSIWKIVKDLTNPPASNSFCCFRTDADCEIAVNFVPIENVLNFTVNKFEHPGSGLYRHQRTGNNTEQSWSERTSLRYSG